MSRQKFLIMHAIRSSINILISPKGEGQLFAATSALVDAEYTMQSIDHWPNHLRNLLLVFYISWQLTVAVVSHGQETCVSQQLILWERYVITWVMYSPSVWSVKSHEEN